MSAYFVCFLLYFFVRLFEFHLATVIVAVFYVNSFGVLFYGPLGFQQRKKAAA